MVAPSWFVPDVCGNGGDGSPASTNIAPAISFIWPAIRPGVPTVTTFATPAHLKLKVSAFDSDGAISAVHFFAGTNLIGTVTTPPYNLIWNLPLGFWQLRAVAVDNNGLTSEVRASRLVSGIAGGRLPEALVDIISPPRGSMLAANAKFDFGAELLVSMGENGSIGFLVDGNLVGTSTGEGELTATTPPAVLSISSLNEGIHVLGVTYTGAGELCRICPLVTNQIRVVRLGLHSPRLRPDGARQFEVVTAYPTDRHVVEVSDDLVDWCNLSEINSPGTNTFTFTLPGPAPPEPQYYRVMVPTAAPGPAP